MNRRVMWSPEARERLRHAPPHAKRELTRATKNIDALWDSDAKRLDHDRELYSLKVGDWRVILAPLEEPAEFEVEHVGHRSLVYDPYPRPTPGELE